MQAFAKRKIFDIIALRKNRMELYLKPALLGFFTLCVLVQVFYYLFFYLRLSFAGRKARNQEMVPVSVVICARDEATNLSRNLPSILEQDYPDFEVVVINDCSEDGTEDVLRELKQKYPRLVFSTTRKDEKFRHGKKLALTLGIKAAKNEHLLLTDADCRPASGHWIRNMQRHFDPKTSFVLGYGGFLPQKGLLNKMIRLDAIYIAMQYLGFALAGIPYMGVGRNLAYRRSVFFENRGFAGHSHIESGDDDLFVNRLARKGNTRVEFSKESHTRSAAPPSWQAWFRQKRRHLTTGIHYRKSTFFLLFLEGFTRFFTFPSFILLLCLNWFLIPVLLVFSLRAVLLLTVLKLSMRHLNEKDLFLSSFLYDLCIIPVNLILGFLNLISTKQRAWK